MGAPSVTTPGKHSGSMLSDTEPCLFKATCTTAFLSTAASMARRKSTLSKVHVQESVFEGELTPAAYKKLTKELEKIITDDDHVAIYYSYNSKMIKKQEIGKSIDKTCFIID